MLQKRKFQSLTVIALICWLCFFLPEVKGQSEPDTAKILSGYLSLPDSLLSKLTLGGTYKNYDPWNWRTIMFPNSTDTMRIIIDKDTLFTDENYFRVLIRYELKKTLGKK